MDVLTAKISDIRGAGPHGYCAPSIIVEEAESGNARTTVGPATVDRHIGWRLYQRRVRMGYSQAELAKAVGVSFQQIHKYERASNRVSASRLWLIATALDVEIDYFYKDMQR